MTELRELRFGPYAVRFVGLHLVVTIAVTAAMGALTAVLAPSSRVTLDAFGVFRPLTGASLLGFAGRAIVLAVVLYPFMPWIFGHRRPAWMLFGALWGLAVIGSVEPMPGSIEGVIYVQTQVMEHLIALAGHGVQVAAFVGAFLAWQRRSMTSGPDDTTFAPAPVVVTRRGFVARFAVIHVVTYAVAGMVFYTLQDYETLFATEEMFTHYRPLDGDPFVAAAIPIQILRGALLAWLVLPFAPVFIRSRHGWALLFVLIWGLTFLGTPLLVPDIVASSMVGSPIDMIVAGAPEVTVQMLVFSVLLTMWQRRSPRPGRVEG